MSMEKMDNNLERPPIPNQDLLPLIPKNEETHDASHALRESFQEILNQPIVPQNIVDNLTNYNSNESVRLRIAAEGSKIEKQSFEEAESKLLETEYNILFNQACGLIRRNELEEDPNLFRLLQLKKLHLCKDISEKEIDHYGLLKSSDLLPNSLQQSVDFRYSKELHLCFPCKATSSYEEEIFVSQQYQGVKEVAKRILHKCKKRCLRKPSKVEPKKIHIFEVKPHQLEFINFELNTVYKQTIKLVNRGQKCELLIITSTPKSPLIKVKWAHNRSLKVAPGMSMLLHVEFSTPSYINFNDSLIIASDKTTHGEIDTSELISIKIFRDSPKLRMFVVHRSLRELMNVESTMEKNVSYLLNSTGGHMEEIVNKTIDCGTCLIQDFVILSVILENTGTPGKFFIVNSQDWHGFEFQFLSEDLVLDKNCFWIYPSYFEINSNDRTEVLIIFKPDIVGLLNECIYLVCDNNCYQQIDLVGDAVYFDEKCITVDIPPSYYRINLQRGRDISLNVGDLVSESPIAFKIAITNRCCVTLPFYILLEEEDSDGVNKIDTDWLHFEIKSKKLQKYSRNDILVNFSPSTDNEGFYQICISIFISKVPVPSIKEDQECYVLRHSNCCNIVDVLILKLHLFCYIEKFVPKTGPVLCEKSTDTKKSPERLTFSEDILDLGLIPLGIDVEKSFSIKRTPHNQPKMEKLFWKIAEMKYDVDVDPHLEFICSNHVSCTEGVFNDKNSKKHLKLIYKIVNRPVGRWVSILLLLTRSSLSEDFLIESVCFVTFEVIKYDVRINTGHPTFPILCPFQLFYVGIPEVFSITLENCSNLTACYYFLKPRGKDADFIDIMVHEKCGILPPASKKEINLSITCKKVGIFENIFLPCFIGIKHDLVMMRVLCGVDFGHVDIFIPNRENSFQKIGWPPKILYEHEHQWDYCPCELFEKYNEEQLISDQNLNKKLSNVQCLCNTDSYSSSSDFGNQYSKYEKPDLVSMIQDAFTDQPKVLQKTVFQVFDVQPYKPTKINFHLENITPLRIKFAVESSNFSVFNDNERDKNLTDLFKDLSLFRPQEEIWLNWVERNPHDIIVEPEIHFSTLEAKDLTSIELWIFATTWGVYMEEIMVHLEDLPSFVFSLLIQVTGCPIEFPFATNSISGYPSIRFGNIVYKSEDRQREVVIRNRSSVPLAISWRVFQITKEDESLPFNLWRNEDDCQDELLANQVSQVKINDLLKVDPVECVIEPKSKFVLSLLLKVNVFPVDLKRVTFKCIVVGLLSSSPEYLLESNYFLRKLDNESPLQIYTFANFELPTLSFGLSEDETFEETDIHVHVNQILFENIEQYDIKWYFTNNFHESFIGKLSIDPPFQILEPEDYSIKVPPKESLLVILRCKLNIDLINQHVSKIYKQEVPVYNLKRLFKKVETDSMPYNVKIESYLRIKQENLVIQNFPLALTLHYPHMKVKPDVVKFNPTLIGYTKKLMFTIYNYSKYSLRYKLYLSSESVFILSKYSGEIKGSTGVNEEFEDIFVIFSPIKNVTFTEHVKVESNLPEYFIEITLSGRGSKDEKFEMPYKL